MTPVSNQLNPLLVPLAFNILDSQANYEQYLSAKAAYDANPTGLTNKSDQPEFWLS